MNNHRLFELMEGARNCVSGIANVTRGEKVLILEDRSGFADPLVGEAIGLACEQVGADVVFATSREFEARVEDPPLIIQNAMRAADVLFHITSHEATLHCRAARIAMMEYGLRVIAVVANTTDLMCSEWAKFPVELFMAIAGKVHDQIRVGKTIKVVSPNGTNISASINPSHIMGCPMDENGVPSPPLHGDAMFTMFPVGTYGVHPLDPAEGTIVYDCLLGQKGMLKTPIKVEIRDHYVHSIEGGKEAEWFKDLIESKKKLGIESDYWSEIMWGLNPKASIERGLELIHLRESEMTRRAGTLHFGIGKGARGFHWDGVLVHPFSVFVDGKPLIDSGRLVALDHPDVIEVAKKYGDPAQLLTETP